MGYKRFGISYIEWGAWAPQTDGFATVPVVPPSEASFTQTDCKSSKAQVFET